MQTIYHRLALRVAALALASLLALHSPSPAYAAGTVTDCTTYGPGPGTRPHPAVSSLKLVRATES